LLSFRAIGVGILKVMAKMGISTLASYKGAQIFEVRLGGGGVTSRYSTAKRYFLHWIDWVSQRHTHETRKPPKVRADKTSPPKKNTDMATATHTEYSIVHSRLSCNLHSTQNVHVFGACLYCHAALESFADRRVMPS
jgi:glutamate synthase domain-containing protein 2